MTSGTRLARSARAARAWLRGISVRAGEGQARRWATLALAAALIAVAAGIVLARGDSGDADRGDQLSAPGARTVAPSPQTTALDPVQSCIEHHDSVLIDASSYIGSDLSPIDYILLQFDSNDSRRSILASEWSSYQADAPRVGEDEAQRRVQQRIDEWCTEVAYTYYEPDADGAVDQ